MTVARTITILLLRVAFALATGVASIPSLGAPADDAMVLVATRALQDPLYGETVLIEKPLDNNQIAELAGRGRLVRFGHGETVISKGDAGDSLFLIVSGQASVKLAREGGGEVLAGVLKTGDTFGEMSLLTGAPRNATVMSESDLRLLEIGKDALGPVLQQNPVVVEALSRLMADRQLATEGFFKQQQQAAGAAAIREDRATALLRNIRNFFSI